MGAEFVQFSLTPILIGMLAAIACALPGNFLILRRQALIGDAISHVVLPGIVVAFLVTGTVAAIADAAGGGGRGRGRGGPDRGGASASAGSSRAPRWASSSPRLFAGGVLLLEQSDTSSVHLDVEHALMGNLKSLIWLRAEGWALAARPGGAGRPAAGIAAHRGGLRADRRC